MSETVKIVGGKRLSGEVRPIPNKNSLVAVLPAAILTDEDVIYHQVPDTSDVDKILKILVLLGAKVSRQGETVTINCKDLHSWKVDENLGGQFRASLMFAGPLLARFGQAQVPVPGGCDLGMRSIAAHVDAFRKAGVFVTNIKNCAQFIAPKTKTDARRIWQLEASVTGTENLALYGCGISGTTEIVDAASEPHVTDLMILLEKMGAKIEGSGSNRLKITGGKLKGATFDPRPDFVDIAGYMVAAAVTRGEITLKGANIPDIVDGLVNWFSLFNVSIKRSGEDLVVNGESDLKIDLVNSGFPLAAPNLPKLVPRPWPGFPVDVIPVMAVLASRTEGRLLLQNWMYESGMDFVRELNALGADIFVSDPQRIIIRGPVQFTGGEVTPPDVIQAVKAVFLAALCDPVETVIHGVGILKRRYPDIFKTYQELGAEISLLD
jgi:UDP-N-acetylglucosamine 1-carboxyvinyltransferase